MEQDESEPASVGSEQTLSDFRETHKDRRIREPLTASLNQGEGPSTITKTWWPWWNTMLTPAMGDQSNQQPLDTLPNETTTTQQVPIEVLSETRPIQPPPESTISPQTTEQTPLEHLNTLNADQELINTTMASQIERRESWVDWINPVPRMNSVVSYIYTPVQQDQLTRIQSNHSATRTPSLSRTSSRAISVQNTNNYTSWFTPWSYFTAVNTTSLSDIPDSMYSSKDSEEIAKDAKLAIQSNGSLNSNSSWAFWQNKKNPEGELAVFGTSSELHPARMSSPPATYQENQENSLKNTPTSMESNENLVVPKFEDCYREFNLQTRTRILLSSSKLLKQTFEIKPQTHLYKSSKKAIIKKAVVIGIHGFFPIKMVRSLIGHPTGTSMKFAENASSLLAQWAKDNDMVIDIETIALEGEGKIIERVENLIGLLENWLDIIQEADFIYVASHSQGVIVAMHLIAEMISRSYISMKNTKIGMLNMCAVCNGPIVGLDSKLIVKLYSKFENEILMELFDFQDLKSYQSVRLLQSIKVLVSNNVKITFVGSMNDQLSPLYSSLFTMVSHPNIARAVFVDKNTTEEIPEFLVKLMECALRVVNMGYSDCDMISELSQYSSGSLTNGGHSKIYNDSQVYLLGIRNALETQDLFLGYKAVLKIHDKEFNAKNINKNPYYLPWCLRGFMDEMLSIKNIDSVALRDDLLKSCNDWNPQSKTHKKLKACVEVICQKY